MGENRDFGKGPIFRIDLEAENFEASDGTKTPFYASFIVVSTRRTPHPVIVAIRDNKDYIRVLLYSYYTTTAGGGVLLKDPLHVV